MNSYRARLAVALLLVVLAGCNTLTGRAIRWRDADMGDIDRFPARVIPRAAVPWQFPVASSPIADQLFAPMKFTRDGASVTEDFADFLERRDTYGFLVIHRDTLVYERYFQGHDRGSIETTFSVSKSLVSIATGIAIDRGWFAGVSDPITRYIPELRERDPAFAEVTLEHLLTMTSGVDFRRGKTPWSDEARSYYAPDLRDIAANRRLVTTPGTSFLYNPYNPIIIGLALERASGRPLTTLLADGLWSRIGTEFDASWSLDATAPGFEKMESGFNATPIDLAKIGRLFLREGSWNGTRVLDSAWVRASVTPDSAMRPHYGYFWWVRPIAGEPASYYAEGRFGQFIYVNPARDLIIVRTGRTSGEANWLSVFEALGRRAAQADSGSQTVVRPS